MISSAEAQNMLIQEITRYALNVAIKELPARTEARSGSNPGTSDIPGIYDPTSGDYQPFWRCGDIVNSAPNG